MDLQSSRRYSYNYFPEEVTIEQAKEILNEHKEVKITLPPNMLNLLKKIIEGEKDE